MGRPIADMVVEAEELAMTTLVTCAEASSVTAETGSAFPSNPEPAGEEARVPRRSVRTADGLDLFAVKYSSERTEHPGAPSRKAGGTG